MDHTEIMKPRNRYRKPLYLDHLNWKWPSKNSLLFTMRPNAISIRIQSWIAKKNEVLRGNPTPIDRNEVLTWCVGAVANYTIQAGLLICHQRSSQFHRVDCISIPNHSRSRNTKEYETTIMIACGLNVKTMRLVMIREEGLHIPNLVFRQSLNL